MTPSQLEWHDLMKWEFQTGVEFLEKGRAGRRSKILIAPEADDSFMKFLTSLTMIDYELIVNDVEPVLQKSKNEMIKSRAKRDVLSENEPNFEHYWTYEEMEAYSIKIEQQYPHLVKRDVIGKSIEGRDIFGLRISSGSEFGKKPIIFIDTGTHAREWVGPHTTLYFLDQLITNSSVTNELLEKVDWVIIPIVNPDGYVYTHTEDRFWRKNRRQVNYTCTGIDLNRNYAYVWQYVPNSVSYNALILNILYYFLIFLVHIIKSSGSLCAVRARNICSCKLYAKFQIQLEALLINAFSRSSSFMAVWF